MSLIKPQHVTVSNSLRSIGFYIKKEQSKWKTILHTTRMSNFVEIEIFMLKSNQLFDDRELVFEKKQLNIKGQPFLWVSGERWKFFMCEWGWVGAGVSIFWVVEGGWLFPEGEWGWVEVCFLWTFFMGGWGWVEVYFGWVWVGGDEWGWPLVMMITYI